MKPQSLLKPLSAARRFLSGTYRSYFLVLKYERYLSTGYGVGADRHETTTALQRTQWQSSTHADPMEDEPFTMFALLLLLAATVVMAGLVIGGVL